MDSWKGGGGGGLKERNKIKTCTVHYHCSVRMYSPSKTSLKLNHGHTVRPLITRKLLDAISDMWWEPNYHTEDLTEHKELLFHKASYSRHDIASKMTETEYSMNFSLVIWINKWGIHCTDSSSRSNCVKQINVQIHSDFIVSRFYCNKMLNEA